VPNKKKIGKVACLPIYHGVLVFSSRIRANYFIFTEGVRKLFPSAVPLYQFSGILLSSVETSFWGTMAKAKLSNECH